MQQYINQLWDDSIVPTLSDYITIPNQSPLYDADWEKKGHMDEAVALMAGWCNAHAPEGMHLEVLREAGRTPLIYMDIPSNIDVHIDNGTEKTILFYGHLDKQPEMTGWDEDLGAWKPVIKDDKLYGRGGADDGYAIFSSVTAILALQAQAIPHARCVILIEASEESGSIDLPFYLEKLGDRIGSPNLIICLDSGAGNYDQMWTTTSLRGNLTGDLHVSLLREGVHSGLGSGIVADSFRVARELLSRIEDPTTGKILLDACQVTIPQERIEEAKVCAAALKETVYTKLPFHTGTQPVLSDPVELILNATWRAALSITGAGGLPALANSGNVSRPVTSLKLSMRIPPGCDPVAVEKALKTALETDPPYHAKVSYQTSGVVAAGWHAPITEPWLAQICQEASQAFFGKPSVSQGEGGTIPFMAMIGKQFPSSQFVITGVLGPASNAHGPNEFLHIPTGKKLTACIAMIVAKQFVQ